MKPHPLTYAISFLLPVFAFCAWDYGLVALPCVAISTIPLACLLAILND